LHECKLFIWERAIDDSQLDDLIFAHNLFSDVRTKPVGSLKHKRYVTRQVCWLVVCKTIVSMAADTVVLSTEEAGRILRTSTPDELRERRAKAK